MGGSGAVLGTYVGMPFDTQSRSAADIQLTRHSKALGIAYARLCCTRAPRSVEGFSPALTSALTENLVVFAANGVFRCSISAALHKDGNSRADDGVYLGFWEEAMVGVLRFLAPPLICPREVMEGRMQCNRSSAAATIINRNGMSASSAGYIESGLRLWREEGLRVSFVGSQLSGVGTCHFYVVFFSAYLHTLTPHARFGVEKQSLPAYHIVMGGGIAGVFGWGTVFPLDVVKSRVQLGTMGHDISLVQTHPRRMFQVEGLRSILRGYLPAVLRGFPANGALFLGVETMNKLFKSHRRVTSGGTG